MLGNFDLWGTGIFGTEKWCAKFGGNEDVCATAACTEEFHAASACTEECCTATACTEEFRAAKICSLGVKSACTVEWLGGIKLFPNELGTIWGGHEEWCTILGGTGLGSVDICDVRCKVPLSIKVDNPRN